MIQRTLVLVKPDGVQRTLVGEILRRLERRGLKLVGLKLMQVSSELAGRHYAEHRAKPFYPGLIAFITSGSSVATGEMSKATTTGGRPRAGPAHSS